MIDSANKDLLIAEVLSPGRLSERGEMALESQICCPDTLVKFAYSALRCR